MSKKVLIPVAVLALAGLAAFLYLSRTRTSGPKFRKEKVERGDVVATVTATGTLSAVTTVKVGSQVSGIIAKLAADFNSEVRKGQLLAELDPTPFQANVDQRRADLSKAKVELRNSELTFARAKKLLEEQLQSQSEFDAAKAGRDGAAAVVEQAAAGLKQAETNLEYTKILSPIDGVVVDRQYDVGQTVAASFQAPVLFTIAQDLTKMQVLTNIDEADIGRVKVGQEATFTVDAFPDRSFKGAVSQIRLSPQTVQNVVTYPVVLDVPNPKIELRPGMTANVLVPVDRREGVLRVANAALRFRPDPADIVGSPKGGPQTNGAAQAAGQGAPGEERRGPGGLSPLGNGSAPGGRPGARRTGGGPRSTDVFVEVAEGKLKRVTVKTSITDGNYTAVESDQLKEGDEIVLGLSTARALNLGSGAPMGGPRGRM